MSTHLSSPTSLMDQENYASSQQPSNEEPMSKRRRTATLTAHPPREVGLMRNLPGDKFSSFVGSASGIYFIRSVYGAIRHSHSSDEAHTETPERDIVPGEDDHLPPAVSESSKQIWKDHEITTENTSNIEFRNLVEWSESYFANWHPAYPFLHAPAVLDSFDRVSKNEAASEDAYQNFEMIIVRSIMSISLADRRQALNSTGSQFPSTLVFKSYDAAMDSLQTTLSRPASIQALQAAISVQLFLVSMLRLNAASRLGGLILRMALQLGLHRCPNRFASFSPSERELRQRLFWSIYCIDRSICHSMGLPLSLHDDDIDVCYPSEERHQPPSVPPEPRLRLVEFLARHSEIRGRIMELRNKSIQHSQKESDQAVAITAKLTQWWNDIEDFTDSECPILSTYHRTVLTILYHESIISLNRPVLAFSTTSSAYDVSLQHCIGSSRSIISTLHGTISHALGGGDAHATLPLLWPSFTWAVWMSTFILFHAANKRHVSQSMVSRLAERSLMVLRHVSKRGNVWPDACASAIQHLQLHQQQHRPASSQSEGIPTQNLPLSASIESQATNLRDQPAVRPTPASSSVASTTAPPKQPLRHASGRDVGSGTEQIAGSTLHPSDDGHWTASSHLPSRVSNVLGVIDDNFVNSEGISNNFGSSDTNSGLLQWNEFMQSNHRINDTMPPTTNANADPFAGFDIPFWLGQDEYSGMVNEWS